MADNSNNSDLKQQNNGENQKPAKDNKTEKGDAKTMAGKTVTDAERIQAFNNKAENFRAKPETIRTLTDYIISSLKFVGNQLTVYKSDEVLNSLSKENPGLFEQVVSTKLSNANLAEAMSRIKALQGLATKVEVEKAAGDLLIDKIKIVFPQLNSKPAQTVVMDVAACKASNEAVLYIKEGTTNTVTIKSIMSAAGLASSQRSSLRTSKAARNKVEFFSQGGAKKDDKGIVTKSVNLNEYIISANIDLDDICDVSTLDTLLNTIQYLQYKSNLAAFSAFAGSDKAEDILRENMIIINKSLYEDIFRNIFEGRFGELDLKSAAEVDRYVSLENKYKKRISELYTLPVASSKAEVGIFAQSKSISEVVKWTNIRKTNRVRQNKVGSYYVASNIDTGCYTIQVPDNFRAEYYDVVGKFIPIATNWLNNEVLYKIGIEPNEIDTTSLSKYQITEEQANTSIASILKLKDDAVANLDREQYIRNIFMNTARNIIDGAKEEDILDRVSNAAEQIEDIMSGKGDL